MSPLLGCMVQAMALMNYILDWDRTGYMLFELQKRFKCRRSKSFCNIYFMALRWSWWRMKCICQRGNYRSKLEKIFDGIKLSKPFPSFLWPICPSYRRYLLDLSVPTNKQLWRRKWLCCAVIMLRCVRVCVCVCACAFTQKRVQWKWHGKTLK